MQFTPDDLRSGDFVWLLDLRVGGRTLYIAEEEVSAPVGPLGETIDYSAGLSFDGELARRADPFGDAPVSMPASIVVDPASANLDVPSLVAEGHLFAAARGRLRLWARGTTRTATRVDGVVAGFSYAFKDEPLAFELREDDRDDPGLFPPERARINGNTWPQAAENAVGQFPPWILGTPGLGSVYATQAPMCSTIAGFEKLLIAGHEVAASSVAVINDKDGTNATISVTTTSDGLGRTVSTVTIGGTAVTVDTEARYWIKWSSGGGLVAPDGSAIRGAGDVWAWIMGYSRMRIDWARVHSAAPALNAYAIDMAITTQDRFGPWDFVEDHLLPILPVSIRASDDGLYPAVYPLGAVSARVSLSDARGEVEAVTDVSFSRREDVASAFVIQYAEDQRADTFSRRQVLTGDPTDTDPDAVLNLYCVRSRNTYRGPDGEPDDIVDEISSEAIWDDATAAAVVLWRAQWRSTQQPLIGVSASPDVAGVLDVGDVVELTYSPFAISGRLFVVEEIGIQPGGFVGLDLRGLSDVAREG